MNLLLDTCTLLWLAAAPTRLSDSVVAAIDDDGTQLFLSDVSVWELCLKWQAGKIVMSAPPRMWVEEQCAIWRLGALPIARPHLYRVSELPDYHRDPFDRLLVAQAIEDGLMIATPDPQIARYPVGVIW